MRYVLSLNLWGTLQKLREGAGGGIWFRPDDIEPCRKHLARLLAREAEANRTLEVLHLGDQAYLISTEPSALVRSASRLLQRATWMEGGGFRFWPLRGAIASDESEAQDSPIPSCANFRAIPLSGTAPIDAVNLEKSAQKGFRLFVSTVIAAELDPLIPCRPCSTRGVEHFEICWPAVDTGEGSYLNREVGDRPIRTWLLTAASEIAESGGNYGRQLAASIEDLLDWSGDLKL